MYVYFLHSSIYAYCLFNNHGSMQFRIYDLMGIFSLEVGVYIKIKSVTLYYFS